MIKNEIKVDFSNTNQLKDLIETAYFKEGFGGKILGKKHFIKVEESDVVHHTVFKDLNNVTVKIQNEDVIDGSIRMIIDETNGDLRLYPISIYCVKESDKYIFY
jgi:hypothetical protein